MLLQEIQIVGVRTEKGSREEEEARLKQVLVSAASPSNQATSIRGVSTIDSPTLVSSGDGGISEMANCFFSRSLCR